MNTPPPEHADEHLLERYRQASASDPAVPSRATREAILSEARRAAATYQKADRHRWRALRSAATHRWMLPLFGGAAAAALVGLLVVPEFVHAPRGTRQLASEVPMSTMSRVATDAAVDSNTRAAAMAPVEAGHPTASKPRAFARASAPPPPMAPSLGTAGASRMTTKVPSADSADSAESKTSAGHGLLPAVMSGDRQTVEVLLSRGAMVDERDGQGRTALLLATMNHRIDMVQSLLSHGADANASDQSGNTPLRQARLAHDQKILQLLEGSGAR